MKVLQTGKFYPITGGVEKVMYHLVTGLPAQGVESDMLCAACGRPATIEVPGGGRIFAVRTLKKVKATMIAPSMILRLRRIAGNYDIVHIHHPDPMAALALRLSGYRGKVVLHWHADILRQRQLLKVFRPLQQWLINRADVIVGTSPTYIAGSPWLRNVQQKCVCVPIGVERPVEVPQEAVDRVKSRWGGRKIVFSMGRLVSYKGFEYLIDAAQYLPEDYVVIIGGKGVLQDELERRIAELNLGEKVKLTGFIDDDELAAYYRAADVFCMSSVERTEAFGLVQIEAMGCGTPVVATEIAGSGVSWANSHGESGLNVPVRDARAIAGAIMTITADEDTRKKYSAGALRRFHNMFLKETMITHITDIYNQLLSK